MLKTILVALDHSEYAEQLIQTLQQLQLQVDSRAILSHVIPANASEADLRADLPHADSEDLSNRHMEKLLQIYQANLPCPCELEIVTGDPVEEIVRLANIYHADLIVIGSRGLTGLQRVIEGSVSGQVVAEAPCSVLVVKPH